jgi:nifR3 family TIM-barrel protein
MSFFIGNIEIKGRVILAPMAGVTSFSYRKFMKPFGCALTYTEMISDCGLNYGNKRTLQMCYSNGEDAPLGLQLFGGTKETLLKAMDVLEEHNIQYDILDLNLACPVPKVTKNNGGSKRLLDQNELFDMVSAVVKKSKKPVSAKIRLGYDSINVYETCKTLEKAGISFIMVHARTKKELYYGTPHFEEIKDLKNVIKIPFAVSGNIYTVHDALKALEITKADAVLVARGGDGNPLLIKNINAALNGEEYEETSFEKQKKFLFEFIDLLVEEKEEKHALPILKGEAPKFFNMFSGQEIRQLKQKITENCSSINDIKNLINEFKYTNLE